MGDTHPLRPSASMHVRAVIGVVAVCAAGVACRGREVPRAVVEDDIVPVAAVPAQVGHVRSILRAMGVVTPMPEAEFLVVAPEPARIVEVTKSEGDIVTAGELLVRFDLPGAAGELSRQRSELALTQATLENARIGQARARDLAARGIIARRELEDADRAVTDAETAVGRTTAALKAAEVAALSAIVRARFDGIVAQRLHNPGDLVQGVATDPVLRVVDPRRLEVTASVPLADRARVLPGATARVVGLAGTDPVRLTIVSTPGSAEAGSADTAMVRLGFTQPAALSVDTQVEVEIDLGERADTVLAPVEALGAEGDVTFLYVAVGDRAIRRVVTTGVVEDDLVEITSGLEAGELVITRGHGGLAEGAVVNVDVQPAR